jgi:hypothetical protein
VKEPNTQVSGGAGFSHSAIAFFFMVLFALGFLLWKIYRMASAAYQSLQIWQLWKIWWTDTSMRLAPFKDKLQPSMIPCVAFERDTTSFKESWRWCPMQVASEQIHYGLV